MSVQPQCPHDTPSRVEVDLLGESVVADVVDAELEADAARGPEHVLHVDVDGSRYRVPASDADPSRDDEI